MSAAPEYFMNEPPESSEPDQRAPQRRDRKRSDSEEPQQMFWHWFAIGVLAFCWIAEASMCAERGF